MQYQAYCQGRVHDLHHFHRQKVYVKSKQNGMTLTQIWDAVGYVVIETRVIKTIRKQVKLKEFAGEIDCDDLTQQTA